MPNIQSPVSVDAAASASEVATIKEAFARNGFDVEVEANLERRAAFVLPWIVQVAVLSPFVAFFKGFGEAAGRDAYEALRSWMHDVFAAREDAESPQGTVQLADPDHTHLEFPTGISDRAFEALRNIDWPEWTGAWMVWDEDRGVWYDPTRR